MNADSLYYADTYIKSLFMWKFKFHPFWTTPPNWTTVKFNVKRLFQLHIPGYLELTLFPLLDETIDRDRFPRMRPARLCLLRGSKMEQAYDNESLPQNSFPYTEST